MYVDFSATDKAVVQRLIASEASSDSAINQGFFFQSELTVGGHAVNVAFLERVVSVFSTKGDATTSARAPIDAYTFEQNKLVNTASKDVQLIFPSPDYMSINGVGHWRTPELAAANGAPSALTQTPGSLDEISTNHLEYISQLRKMLSGYAKANNIAKDKTDSFFRLTEQQVSR